MKFLMHLLEFRHLYSSILSPQHTAFFLHSLKLFRNKIWIKFDKDSSVVEQNDYATKIVHIYIDYELDTWSKISVSNFKLRSFYSEKQT